MIGNVAMSPEALRKFFERKIAIFIARAPGRLDIMGGIGDYSGSLVLELPIAEAAYVAVQRSHDGNLFIASLGDSERESVTITSGQWAELRGNNFDSARQFFARDSQSAWAAYIAGPLLVLLSETASQHAGGLRIVVESQVPEGKGVSSSAALEVATMRAFAALLEIELAPQELARLCQLAENRVVGAPCGIMDQMTSALGRANQLLALRCQPAAVEGFVPIPQDLAFWAIDSGIRHAVSGSDYTSVRCGTFMGYRIIADAASLHTKPAGDAPHLLDVNDPFWNGYLANITPSEFIDRFAEQMPEIISGHDFLQQYGGTTDRATRVDATRIYAVRAPTLHPIEENARAQRFRMLLERPIDEPALREMGRLMSAAHDSYTACGLASPGTDLLVKLVREADSKNGLYGAKTTGGGSGGVVAILGRSDADAAINSIARRYVELTGHESRVFRGSSPGAYGTPVQEIVI